MTPTFEKVLNQAKNLTFDEKTKLIEMLTDKKTVSKKTHSSQKDEKVLAELKRIIDEQEKNPNSEMTKSAETSENRREKIRAFRGKFRPILPSVEEFLAEKSKETELEERR